MTLELSYPLGVAGAGASFAASGLAALRSRANVGVVAAVAAGALSAILAFDLVPDLLTGARSSGVPITVLPVIATAAFAGLWLVARPGHDRRPATGAGLLGPAFLIHGFLEGVAGGAVLGWHARVGAGFVAALILHKTAEGADLAAALRGVDASTQGMATARRRAWLICGAAGPPLGCAVALIVPLPGQVAVVVTTAVCCVLARACVKLLRRAATTAAALPAGVAAIFGGAIMAAVLVLS